MKDVKTILDDVLHQLADRRAEISRLREDENKLVQLAMALVAVLPKKDQKSLSDKISRQLELKVDAENRLSLVTAIKLALRGADGEFLTAAKLRDEVKKRGFDFTDYKSNPLASVATTVRRLQKQMPLVIEVKKINGVAAYRIAPERIGEK